MSSDDRIVPDRKGGKAALRAANWSNRQVDALFRGGWKMLVSESQAEADELRDKLAALDSRLKLPRDPVV